jgi:para-nitrobenzyl esterase
MNAPTAVACPSSPVANTTYGPVKGTLTPGVAEFLGVRYAASTAGNLRWTPPKPPTRWAKPINATQFGNACPQTASPFPTVPTGEDCLFLNLYVPTSHGTDIFNQGENQARTGTLSGDGLAPWRSLERARANYDPTPSEAG